MGVTNSKADASFPATIEPAVLLEIPNSFSKVGIFTTVNPLTTTPGTKNIYFCKLCNYNDNKMRSRLINT